MRRIMKTKKLIVAVSLEEEAYKPLLGLKEMDIDSKVEIHLVHVMPIILCARGMDLTVQTYPLPEEKPRLQEQIIAALTDIKKEIFPTHKNVICKCLFAINTKAAFTDYVHEEKGDLVVVATRGKYGIKNFFDSSFAQHQVKHSAAKVLVLR
jgi:nucleotide-binding universal stress UspA family protein